MVDVNLYNNNIIVEFRGKKYRLGLVKNWKDDLVTISVGCAGAYTGLGISGTILFARKSSDGKQLKIVGKWGEGSLYLQYLIDFADRFT